MSLAGIAAWAPEPQRTAMAARRAAQLHLPRGLALRRCVSEPLRTRDTRVSQRAQDGPRHEQRKEPRSPRRTPIHAEEGSPHKELVPAPSLW